MNILFLSISEAISNINNRGIYPDLVHLRNIHGYYLNYPILFDYLNAYNKPVVWTFHDCWPFTGHCSFFDRVNCFRWQSQCYDCPNLKGYPTSLLIDRSKKNFVQKKQLFTSIQKLTIITPSVWLTDYVKQSFFKNFTACTIRNGIDISVFKPQKDDQLIKKLKLKGNRVVLGVANVWDKRKGLADFISLSQIIGDQYKVILVGLSQSQFKGLPNNIIPISHTNSIQELAQFYSLADVFINPTYADNFPTTNIEALACGTPVVTYKTGGSPEAVDAHTGFVVEKGDVKGLAEAIKTITNKGKEHYTSLCRARAEQYFNKDDRFMDYLRLYEKLTL